MVRLSPSITLLFESMHMSNSEPNLRPLSAGAPLCDQASGQYLTQLSSILLCGMACSSEDPPCANVT